MEGGSSEIEFDILGKKGKNEKVQKLIFFPKNSLPIYALFLFAFQMTSLASSLPHLHHALNDDEFMEFFQGIPFYAHLPPAPQTAPKYLLSPAQPSNENVLVEEIERLRRHNNDMRMENNRLVTELALSRAREIQAANSEVGILQKKLEEQAALLVQAQATIVKQHGKLTMYENFIKPVMDANKLYIETYQDAVVKFAETSAARLAAQ